MKMILRCVAAIAMAVFFSASNASAQNAEYDLYAGAPQNLLVPFKVEFYDPNIIPFPIILPDGSVGFVDITVPRWSTVDVIGDANLTALFATRSIPGGGTMQEYLGHRALFAGLALRQYRFSGSFYDNAGTLHNVSVTSYRRP